MLNHSRKGFPVKKARNFFFGVSVFKIMLIGMTTQRTTCFSRSLQKNQGAQGGYSGSVKQQQRNDL